MTVEPQRDSPRWRDYVLTSGQEFTAFWESHLHDGKRHVLFVLGKGFDPRMCLAFEALINAGGDGRRDILAINFKEGEASPSRVHAPLVDANWNTLQALLNQHGTLSVRQIDMWSEDGRRIGSRSAAAVFNALADFIGYTDVVIDISAMPRSVYFPLIAKVLYLLDETIHDVMERKPNLHVCVAENPRLDTRICDVGVDEDATYVHPFSGGLEMEATAGQPKIWIPILGERQETQLKRIYDLIDVPDEICPVLPFPALDPRRGDNLVLEYRDLLFDRLRIEPRNFIYASERNPFEVYRLIRQTILHYREVLGPLGGCRTVLSAYQQSYYQLAHCWLRTNSNRRRLMWVSPMWGPKDTSWTTVPEPQALSRKVSSSDSGWQENAMRRKSPFDYAEHTPVVVGTGLVALDVVINSDMHRPPRLWAGGTCGNVLIILSYLGWHTYPVARLNEDAASEHVRRDLCQWGVHLEFVQSDPGGSTPIIVQQISHNTTGKAFHTFSWSCPHCGALFPRYKAVLASEAGDIAAQIKHSKVFFLDRVSRGALILARASAAKGALVVFEPSSLGDPRLFQEALALAHILKYSHERMGQLGEAESAVGPLLEIETLGEEGLRYRSTLPSCISNGWKWLNAYAVGHAKDAAGAGDWCTAGIIHRLGQQGLQGFHQATASQVLDALCFGQALAAWNCGFEGARGGMYSMNKEAFRSDIEQIMSGNGVIQQISHTSNSVVKEVLRNLCPTCGNKRV